MAIWEIVGFRGETPTGFTRRESGRESRIRLLLERLVARHLTEDEITDATLGTRNDFVIHRDKRMEHPTILMTNGTDYHYVAKQI